MGSKKNKVKGRPTKYHISFPGKARKMVGLTHADMSKNLGIALSSFNLYREKYSAFSEAIKEADDKTDLIVESALFRRAIGYEHPDVHISNYKGKITITDITKHYPPDATSLIFWLKNRRPDLWRDRHELEHSGSIGLHPIQSELEKLSDKDLLAIAEKNIIEDKKK